MPSHHPLRHYRRYPRRSRTPRALRWFALVVLLLLLLLPLFAGCAPQSAETERGTAHSEAAFTLPDIPPLLVTPPGARFLPGGALLARVQLPRYCAHFPSGSHRAGVGRFSGYPLARAVGRSAEQPYGNDGLRRCGQCHVRSLRGVVEEIPLRAQLAFPQRGVLHPCAAPRHCFAPSGRTGQGTPQVQTGHGVEEPSGRCGGGLRLHPCRRHCRQPPADKVKLYPAVLQLARLRGLPPGEGLHGRFGVPGRYDGRGFRPPSPAGYPGRLSR